MNIVNNVAIWSMAITYTILLILVTAVIPYKCWRKKSKKERFEQRIISLLQNNNNLNFNDIKFMSEALDLNEFCARKIIKRLYYADGLDLNLTRELQESIQKEEPFDGCADELKPTLIAIHELLILYGDEGQKHLLNPIIAKLQELNQIEHDHGKMKRQNYIAYVVAIVSLVIGSIGFYYTVTAPSANEVANAVVEQLHRQ